MKRGDDARAIWLCVGTESDPEKLDHTRFMIFDFDDHNTRLTTVEIHAKVARVATTLADNDVPHRLFLSGGGHGMHIWVTFDTPKRVDVMKQLTDVILKKAGLKRKAGGELADGFVEVLPKGIGRQVCALPHCRKSIRMPLSDDGAIRETSPQATIVEFYVGKKASERMRKTVTPPSLSKTYSPDYPTLYFSMNAEDRGCSETIAQTIDGVTISALTVWKMGPCRADPKYSISQTENESAG